MWNHPGTVTLLFLLGLFFLGLITACLAASSPARPPRRSPDLVRLAPQHYYVSWASPRPVRASLSGVGSASGADWRPGQGRR